MTKVPKRSFLPEGKEPVISRVFQLIERYPSRSEAARAWEMNVNTLQNYYKRRDISPTPRHAHLLKIAKQENVSLEWLLTGEGDGPDLTGKEKNKKNDSEIAVDSPASHSSELDFKILGLLSVLSDNEKKELIDVLIRKGVETVLYLLDENNIRLLQQPDTLKAHMLQEYVTGKPNEGGSIMRPIKCVLAQMRGKHQRRT